jgi:hypothetical protein
VGPAAVLHAALAAECGSSPDRLGNLGGGGGGFCGGRTIFSLTGNK